MKKAYMGLSALCLAFAAVSFTAEPKSKTTSYYFLQTIGGAYATQPYIYFGTPSTTGFECSGGPINCEGVFSGYVTNYSLLTPTSWSPIISDQVARIGKLP